MGDIPTITYSNDVTGRLNGQLYAAVNYAMVKNEIDTINISAISNGLTHSPGGGHYDTPLTSALDINTVNGAHVGAGDPTMKAFYGDMVAFLNKTGSAKAAYGPDSLMEAKGKDHQLAPISSDATVRSWKHKGESKADFLLNQHSNHFHFSVQDQSTFARPVTVVWQ